MQKGAVSGFKPTHTHTHTRSACARSSRYSFPAPCLPKTMKKGYSTWNLSWLRIHEKWIDRTRRGYIGSIKRKHKIIENGNFIPRFVRTSIQGALGVFVATFFRLKTIYIEIFASLHATNQIDIKSFIRLFLRIIRINDWKSVAMAHMIYGAVIIPLSMIYQRYSCSFEAAGRRRRGNGSIFWRRSHDWAH